VARPLIRRTRAGLPEWIPPQLTELVDAAPDGPEWLHEIKFDGYRMHARLDRGAVRLLTRTGLDWTHKYPAIAAAVSSLDAKQAYLDGELCGVRPDGVTSFSMIQAASDAGNAAGLVFYLFDLLYLDGADVGARPLIERKTRLAALLSHASSPLHYSDHQRGQGRAFHEKACAMSLEGIVSKRADAAYAAGRPLQRQSRDSGSFRSRPGSPERGKRTRRSLPPTWVGGTGVPPVDHADDHQKQQRQLER
jgi:ATP-dependent DNA ligase